MSLQLAAQHLASRGRGPDTQLIHMAPQEVAGLHALAKAHGGELTTNPDTGLPEAGFLSSILPMLIGFGLAPFTGGLSAALITGAGYTAATGSLKKGLMAGLGAFGGAGLAGGLSAAGAAGTAAAEAGTGLSAMAPQTAAQLGTGFEASMAAQGITPTLGATGASMGAQTAAQLGTGFQTEMAGLGAAPPAGLEAAAQASPGMHYVAPGVQVSSALPLPTAPMAPPTPMAPPVAAAPAPVAIPTTTPAPITPPPAPAPSSIMDKYSQMGRGVESLMTPEGRTAFMGNAASKGVEASGVGGTSGLMKSGMMAAAPIMFQDPEPFKKPYTGSVLDYDYEYDPTNRTMPFIKVPKTKTAAGGGLMDIQPVEAMSQQNQSQMRPAYAQGGVSDMAVNPYTGAEAFAEGGQSHLGDYSDGGRLLRGPGNGTSDSIPASIGDKRPARLADGEFVVPARIVSELGNGSTEAGARQLYAMMDRVQKARAKTTGKDRVATNTKAERLLPV